MNSIIDRLFITKEGMRIYYQKPNWPIYALILFVGARRISLDSDWDSFWLAAQSVTAIYWGWMELSSGVNLFRKIMGVAVIICGLLFLMIDIAG